jgi:autotransporter adhesin
VAIGSGSSATIAGSVALGQGSISSRALAPTSGQIPVGVGSAYVPYDTTSGLLLGAVSLGQDNTSYRQITNLADGTQPHDAVTLRQLTGAVGSLTVTGTRYFHANSVAADSLSVGQESVAIGPQTVVNGDSGIGLGNGATVMDNGGIAIGRASETMLASGIAIGSQALAGGVQSMALGAGATANDFMSVALGSSSVTAPVVATTSGTINGITYNYAGGAPTSTVSVGSAGNERTITNVAAGRVSATSTDAVNGSQLFATDSAVNNLANTVNNINNGGGVKYFHASSTLADSSAGGTNSVAVGPQAVSSGANSVAMGNGAQATQSNSLALGANSTTSGANSVAVGGGAQATQNNSVALGANSTTSVGAQSNYTGAYKAPGSSNSVGEVSVGSAGSDRKITNVADGSAPNDAVNVSQLQGGVNSAISQANAYTDQQVNNIIANTAPVEFRSNATGARSTGPNAAGNDSAAGGAGAIASGTNSTAVGNNSTASADNSVALGQGSVADRANTVSVGTSSNQRQIVNVAAGTQNTDAVNVSQLNAVKTGSVQYDTNADGTVNNNSVTLGNGGTGTTIHNVAPGVAATDAANVGQINAVQNWSKSYTDQRFETLNSNLNTIGNRANAGVASAMAMANLPQAYAPNQSAVAVGVGSFHGETGLAVGLSTVSEGGRWIFRVSANSNTRGDAGVGAGAAMVW